MLAAEYLKFLYARHRPHPSLRNMPLVVIGRHVDQIHLRLIPLRGMQALNALASRHLQPPHNPLTIPECEFRRHNFAGFRFQIIPLALLDQFSKAPRRNYGNFRVETAIHPSSGLIYAELHYPQDASAPIAITEPVYMGHQQAETDVIHMFKSRFHCGKSTTLILIRPLLNRVHQVRAVVARRP